MVWTRPAGPPHVYRIIDLIDHSGKKRKFSLQEVPEHRHEEAILHMCTIFARDEIMCNAVDVIHETSSLDLAKELWTIILSQGITVGAYEISEVDSEPMLAGLNMLVYTNDEVDKVVKSIKLGESRLGDVIGFVMESSDPVDPRQLHNVDRYLGTFGLSIDPQFRRLGLGQQLLEIRNDIGKRYNIEWSSTVFTSVASQGTATKAGFKTDLERSYEEAVNGDGSPLFPTLKGKSMKVMSKRIA